MWFKRPSGDGSQLFKISDKGMEIAEDLRIYHKLDSIEKVIQYAMSSLVEQKEHEEAGGEMIRRFADGTEESYNPVHELIPDKDAA